MSSSHLLVHQECMLLQMCLQTKHLYIYNKIVNYILLHLVHECMGNMIVYLYKTTTAL